MSKNYKTQRHNLSNKKTKSSNLNKHQDLINKTLLMKKILLILKQVNHKLKINY